MHELVGDGVVCGWFLGDSILPLDDYPRVLGFVANGGLASCLSV